MNHAYAWRALLDTGIILANGSDAPVEPFDPRRTFAAAIAPAGGMMRDEALRSMTIWAAYANFAEHAIGLDRAGQGRRLRHRRPRLDARTRRFDRRHANGGHVFARPPRLGVCCFSRSACAQPRCNCDLNTTFALSRSHRIRLLGSHGGRCPVTENRLTSLQPHCRKGRRYRELCKSHEYHKDAIAVF